MMGPRQVEQVVLLYEFSLDDYVPPGHLLRSVGRFVDLVAALLLGMAAHGTELSCGEVNGRVRFAAVS